MSARRLVVALAGVALFAILAPSQTSAQRRVAVQVVDVAGGRAYLTPGESSGVAIGSRVQIDRRRFRVVGASASYAIVNLRGGTIPVGARGHAWTRRAGADDTVVLETPLPPEAYAGVWPEPALPAESQSPEPVPLGRSSGAPRRLELALSTAGVLQSTLDQRGGTLGRTELRLRGRARPFDDVPLSVLADVAAQLWLADDLDFRRGGASRPVVRVRELQLAYGQGSDLRAAVGRLRRAASTIGTLDGASVRTPVFEGFTIGAFGGFVPNPHDQSPDFETGRFGVELGWSDASHEWRPSLGVVAHGSIFDGAIDERRLSAQAQMFPGDSRFGAHVELSLHDAVNAWGVPALEVSAAGIDGSVRAGPFEIGARFDRRLPERSRWLEHWMPSAWLCAPDLQAGADPRACAPGDDARWTGSLDVALRWEQGWVRAAGTVIHHPSDERLSQLAGLAAVRIDRVLGLFHGDLALQGSTGALLDTVAGTAALGLALPDELLDVSLRYRLAYAIDRADTDGWVEHQVGAAVLVTPVDDLQVWLEVDAITGREVEAIVGQLAATWRVAL